jgi:hypothetical protein
MARIASISTMDPWALWGRPLWRAALSCVAITLLCGLWSLASASGRDNSTEILAQDSELTVFAALNQPAEDVR